MPTEYEKWKARKGRLCRTMHECAICKQKIEYGQAYRDGGYGKRAHEDCVEALIKPTNKTHEWCE